MKRIHLGFMLIIIAFLISACGVKEFYFECNGYYLEPMSEDISGSIGGFPYSLPFTVRMRVVDANGNVLSNRPLVTISATGILTTNGGFHEFSQAADNQPISIYLNAPPEIENELVDMISVQCGDPIIYFTDGRIGPDIATSLNAYRLDNGISIYSEINGSFFVSFDDILAVGNPAVNTLIASYNGIDVYLLSDGLIQIMETPAEDGKRDLLIIEFDEDNNVVRWRRGTFNMITGESNIYLEFGNWDGYPRNY